MTRSVTFKGQTQIKPGGITNINSDGLVPVGATATGIVHLLGEAEGGEPGTVITIDDPNLAKEIFRSGPLADAVKVAFNPSADDTIQGGAFRVVAYKTNQGTQSGTTLPGDEGVADTAAAGSTTTVINLTTGGLTVDAEIGRWFQLDNTNERRRIVDNDASTITVQPGFNAAPAATDPVTILDNQIVLTSEDYGVHTNQVSVELEPGVGEGVFVTLAFEDSVEQSPEIAGEAKLRLKYVGGPVEDSGIVTITDATTLSVDVTVAPLLNAWAGMLVRFADGTQRLIDSNTAADPSVVTLNSAHALSTEDQADLNGTTVEIIDVTSATASITGSNGAALALTTAVLPTADDITVTFATEGISTLRQLVDHLNSTTNFEAVIPDGVNPDTTLLADFDFGTRATAVDVRFDDEISPNDNGSFRQDLVTVINWINNISDLATATRATTGTDEGSELPLSTGGVSGTVRDVPVYFIGGTRGTSSNSDWQTGFDELVQVRGNSIVPLISQDLVNEGNGSTATWESIRAQLRAHLIVAATTAKNEMGGYIGLKGTRDELIAAAAALNLADAHLFGQQMAFLDVDGNFTVMDEWATAVAAAGMRSGAPEVGEPLTKKVVNTNTLQQDASWKPSNVTDANALLEGGVFFAEVNKETKLIEWVRDLTTHVQSDNVALINGDTRDAVRFVAYDLRTHLVDRFVGSKAIPATAASIREAVAAKMGEYLTDNIIVQSLDPETESKVLPGFRNLRVFLEGNVATVRVEIFPVTGIVFLLNDIVLQLPRSVA